MGKSTEAEEIYLRVIEIREKILDKDHPLLAIGLNNLAKLYFAQSLFNKAEPLYRKALDILESRLGSFHPITSKVCQNLQELIENRENSSSA
jgi:tetratricopeptide (TPR) repeat protein